MKNNQIIKIQTRDLTDEQIINFVTNGDIDIYQRKGDRIWSFNHYYPSGAEYYLSGEYHSFDIKELEEYDHKEDIFNNLKLYQDEKSEKEILELLKDRIKNKDHIYQVDEFIYGLEHFIDTNTEEAIYVLV